jgi:F-type H+-transporting ATPase subunit c
MDDPNAIRSLASSLAMLAVTGPALAIGMIGKGALDVIARNPDAYSKALMLMILAISFAEALAIFAFVIAIK